MINNAASVFTGLKGGNGQNQGQASILDSHPDFLPYAQNIYNLRAQERARKALEQKEKDKQWALLQKQLDPSAVQIRDQQQLMGKLAEADKELVDLRYNKKLDPADAYGEGGRKWRDKQFEIENLVKASNENKAWLDTVMKTLNADQAGKYDKAYAMELIKKYNALPTIEEQEKFRIENNPFKEDVSTIDIVDYIAPKLFESTLEKGNVTDFVGSIRPEDVSVLVDGVIQDHPEWYDAGVQDGRWKSPEEMKAVVYKQSVARDPGYKKRTMDEPVRPLASQSKTYNYGGNTWGDYSVSGSRQDSSTPEGEIDTVAVSQNGGSMKELQLIDDNGNVVNGKPAMFRKAPVKTFRGQKSPDSGKWKVYVESVVPAVDESGEPITDSNGAPVMRPQTVVVDYEKNRNQVEAALEGMSVEEWAKTHGQGGQETVAKEKNTGKTATRAQVKEMLKQSPGYTEQELIDYYKSQGYTIK